MNLEDYAERLPQTRSKRRAHPRYRVDEHASLLLVHQGTTVEGRMIELSLGGCRIRTAERFLAGTMVRVEVVCKVLGVAVRFCGVTQWTDGKHQVGIRFLDLSPRKWEQMLQLVDELGNGCGEAQSGEAEVGGELDV
jgi:hypothetical protein